MRGTEYVGIVATLAGAMGAFLFVRGRQQEQLARSAATPPEPSAPSSLA